jgi:hypothetical protein
MASLDILREIQGVAERVRRSDCEINEYWGSVVMEETVSDDLKALVRADLKMGDDRLFPNSSGRHSLQNGDQEF